MAEAERANASEAKPGERNSKRGARVGLLYGIYVPR